MAQIYGPVHEMSAAISYAQMSPINAHAIISTLSYPVRLYVVFLVYVFIYIQALCILAVKAHVSLRIYPVSPEPSLLNDAINSELSCDGLYVFLSLTLVSPVPS